MVEIENASTDPRTPAVRQLLLNLAQICDSMKAYPVVPPPSVPPALLSKGMYATKMDKIYRAALVCCISSIRCLPRLFAPQIQHILPAVVQPILTLDTEALQSMPAKRVIVTTGMVQTVLTCATYDEKRKDSSGAKNAVLAVLMGKGASAARGGAEGGANNNGSDPSDDSGVVEAQKTVTALLAEGTIERIIEALVGKFLRLHAEEIEEWENDPEGRYETDLAERSLLEADSPRHCGGALLLTLMNRETDRVSHTLLEVRDWR